MKNGKTRIALIGFMGTGKSTIGPLLAEKLGYTFIDTDELVERTIGMNIADIFSDLGEDAFRDAEYEALQEALGQEQVVVSTGGGMVLFERNRKLLREKAFVVNLGAAPETVFRRVQGDQTRPLLKSDDPLTRIRQLLAERQEFYSDCDISISTDDDTARECCVKILRTFRNEQ